MDRVLTEPALPGDRAPIVYLPGVARQDLRAGEECRAALEPLVELMYRGTMWLQPNGSDWGVTTFLDWKEDRGKEPQSLRPRKRFPWFWGCPGDGSLDERTDFLGGSKFDGDRWNDLHYRNAARRSARMRAEEEVGRV